MKTHLVPRLTVLALAGLCPLSSQTLVNWTGNGNSNASGNWTTPENWSSSLAPAATDRVTLGNVTTGTRIVTIDTADAIAQRLALVQTSAATNILSITSGGRLTLTNDSAGYNWGAAATGGGTARIDLAGTISLAGRTGGTTTTAALNINTDIAFANGGRLEAAYDASTPLNRIAMHGTIDVNAGAAGVATIARIAPSVTTNNAGDFYVDFGAASHLNVTTGRLAITTSQVNSGADAVNVTTAGTTHIASGASLTVTAVGAGSGSAAAVYTNSGTLTLAGKLGVNGRGGNTINNVTSLTNSGTWRVSGASAQIERTMTIADANRPTLANTATGIVTGTTTSDTLTYVSDYVAGEDLAFTNSGVIAAGAGSSGAGLASVGTLTLVNFAVVNTATASLVFDIGGATAGQFDVLALQSGTFDFTNATLDVRLVNNFAPSESFSLAVFVSDAPTSVTGTITGLTVNGSSNDNYSFSYDNITGIGTLNYSAIPEAASAPLLLGLAGLGLALTRRRRR